MTDFVDVTQTPDELRRIFVSLGLAAESEPLGVQALAGGVSSAIYRIDTTSGSYCLKQALPKLKVAKEWLAPVDRVFAEIDWLITAGEIVPGSVPRVIGTDRTTRCLIMEYLGDHRVWKGELLARRVDPAVAGAVGDVIGRVHAATAHSTTLAARFATDTNFYALRLEPYLVETARVHPELADLIHKLVQTTANRRIALVHGDLSPKNILLGHDGPVLLDAECAWYGDPAFDVAFCLNHLLLKGAKLPQQIEQLMDSFSAFTTAYFPHVDFEPADDLERRITNLLPALTLARVDGKSPAEYLDEEARSQVRASAITLLTSPRDNLDGVRRFWGQEFSR